MKIYFLMTDEPQYTPLTARIFLEKYHGEVVGVSFPPGAANKKRIISTLHIYGLPRFIKMAASHLLWQIRGGRVRQIFRHYRIKSYPVKDINSPDFINLMNALGVSLIISFNCPQIFKKELISVPKNGCINAHFGMLPKYRGIQPIMRAILNNEKEFGVTVHYIDERLDSGDIIAQDGVPISGDDSLDTLYPKAFTKTGELFVMAVRAIKEGSVKRIFNDPAKKTYYSYPDKVVIRQYKERKKAQVLCRIMDFMNLKFSITVILLALAIRLVFCLILSMPVVKDAAGYDKIAVNLASGGGLTYDGKTAQIFRGPIYPLFLAGVYKVFGHSHTAARMVQSFLGAFICLIFYYLAKQYISEAASKIVFLLLALHPVLVSLSNLLLSEIVFIFLLGIAALFLTAAFRHKGGLNYFLAGVFFGLATLTRSVTLYFGPFLFLFQIISYDRKRLALKHICIFLIGQFLVILPWTARNYAVSGQFVPVATGGGIALWQGTQPAHEGDTLSTNKDLFAKYEEIVGKGASYTTLENDKKLFKASLQNIKNDPFGYILLMPVKFQRLFISTYSSFFNIHDISLAEYFKDPNLRKKGLFILCWKVLMLILSVVILIFAAMGVFYQRRNIHRFLPVLAIILFFIIFHTLTFASTRPGVPILPFLLIFTVLGINKTWMIK